VLHVPLDVDGITPAAARSGSGRQCPWPTPTTPVRCRRPRKRSTRRDDRPSPPRDYPREIGVNRVAVAQQLSGTPDELITMHLRTPFRPCRQPGRPWPGRYRAQGDERAEAAAAPPTRVLFPPGNAPSHSYQRSVSGLNPVASEMPRQRSPSVTIAVMPHAIATGVHSNARRPYGAPGSITAHPGAATRRPGWSTCSTHKPHRRTGHLPRLVPEPGLRDQANGHGPHSLRPGP
jgi:hypothetical protein